MTSLELLLAALVVNSALVVVEVRRVSNHAQVVEHRLDVTERDMQNINAIHRLVENNVQSMNETLNEQAYTLAKIREKHDS